MKMPKCPDMKLLALMFAAAAMLLAWLLLNPRHPDRIDIRSKALGENRYILVRVPDGYAAGKDSYPLVVLLDGGNQKQYSGDKPLYTRSKKVLEKLEDKGLPPMILVGIANRDRERDMTPVRRPDIYAGGGEAGAFREFIETEVVPFVAKRWRIGPTRILYGESYGGLFVLDTLARGRQVFTDYIAVSPAVGVWPKGLDDAFHRRFPSPSPAHSLYIICGERDAPLVNTYTPSFYQEIEDILPAGLHRRMDILPGKGHDPENSLELGLRFVFSKEGAPTSEIPKRTDGSSGGVGP